MSYCECRGLERKLAYHTAPALLGIKPASLFSVCKAEIADQDYVEFNDRASCKGLSMRVMCECENRRLVMLYHVGMLDAWLHNMEHITFLRQYGYGIHMTTEEMLERLSVPYSQRKRLSSRNRRISWLSNGRRKGLYRKRGGSFQAMRLLEGLRQHRTSEANLCKL